MTKLYPIKFTPIIKERVWGGTRLATNYGKTSTDGATVGESWEISGVEGDESVVSNGFLKGNNINELVEIYLGEIVGDELYDTYSTEFPVLVKLLDIEKPLSLQVHPDDQTARWRHDSYGKTEFWYILDAEQDAIIYLGLNKNSNPRELYEKCKDDSVTEILNVIHPKKGDFFLIEPGTIHSAKGGLTVAEIQQVSDITYRVYDWGREHDPVTAREMHLELAIDCIDYSKFPDTVKNINNSNKIGDRSLLTDCKYFKVSMVEVSKELLLVSQDYNSFIIYLCENGSVSISSANGSENIIKGESVLIPANIGEYKIVPGTTDCRLLEITGKYQIPVDSYTSVSS